MNDNALSAEQKRRTHSQKTWVKAEYSISETTKAGGAPGGGADAFTYN